MNENESGESKDVTSQVVEDFKYFVKGVLVFIVALSWNSFAGWISKFIAKDANLGAVIFSLFYALLSTLTACLIILYINKFSEKVAQKAEQAKNFSHKTQEEAADVINKAKTELMDKVKSGGE